MARRLLRDGKEAILQKKLGVNKLIFCAPHGLAYTRVDGVHKMSEPCTAEMAIIAAQRLGGVFMIQRDRKTVQGEMLNRLRAKFGNYTLLDIHGMVDDFNLDVCIGTGAAATPPTLMLALELQRSFAAKGLHTALNTPFWAGPSSLTYQFQQQGGHGIQLEFARRGRGPSSYSDKVDVIVETLKNCSAQLSQCIQDYQERMATDMPLAVQIYK